MKNEEDRSKAAIQLLKERLLTSAPPEIVRGRVRTVREIYEHRAVLKQTPGSDAMVVHIAGIILGATMSGERFRTLDCLKVLRSLIRNPEIGDRISAATIRNLFEIYKHYIFSENEEVQWCVSSIVKNQPLDDTAVDWLLANQQASEHILNRLLLFPVAHPKINQWAKEAYLGNSFPERQYQVIALLIGDTLPNYIRKEDSNTIIWAIHKARISNTRKIEMINKYSDLNSIESVVKIAYQMEIKEIMVHLLDKLERMRLAN